MSTLLALVLLMAVISAIVEFRLIASVPGLKWLVTRFRYTGIVLSILLSWLLGAMFGAGGMIVFAASLLSTIFTDPYYAYKRNKTTIHRKVGMVAGPLGPLWMLVKYAFLIVLFPFKVYLRYAKKSYNMKHGTNF